MRRFLVSALVMLVVVASIADPATTNVAQCPYDIQAVLDDCGFTNDVPLQPVCWVQQTDEPRLQFFRDHGRAKDVQGKNPTITDLVLVLSARGTNYVLLSAYRNAQKENARWHRSEISVMYRWGDDWIVGEKEFPRVPTDVDVEKFLDEIWPSRHDFSIGIVSSGRVAIVVDPSIR
jgi:hypothetical protein